MKKNNNTQTFTRGLALSGGGYRATLFAVGSLWRLNQLGILKKITRITSVSGGSITLAWLALNWEKLTFDSHDVATNFQEAIVEPLQNFCGQYLDIKAILTGLLTPTQTIGHKIAQAYTERLFHDTLLSALPAGEGIPEFIFYATNYETGSSVRLTRETLYDYKLGGASSQGITLSQAVAASSAFPPYFSPIVLDSSQWAWTDPAISKLSPATIAMFRKQLTLVDGGLYDNLGLEAIWKTDPASSDHFDQVLVCDAGAPLKMGYDVRSGRFSSLIKKTGFYRNWMSQTARMSDLMIEQQRALRKRELIDNLQAGKYKNQGGYWGITTKIANYRNATNAASDSTLSASLQDVPTRLTKFSDADQGHLINWGYALADAAIRAHVDPTAPVGTQPIAGYKLP